LDFLRKNIKEVFILLIVGIVGGDQGLPPKWGCKVVSHMHLKEPESEERGARGTNNSGNGVWKEGEGPFSTLPFVFSPSCFLSHI
jgi:hypothetical protein